MKIKLVVLYLFLGSCLYAQVSYDINILATIAGSEQQYRTYSRRPVQSGYDILNTRSKDGIINTITSTVSVLNTLVSSGIPIPGAGSIGWNPNAHELTVKINDIPIKAKVDGNTITTSRVDAANSVADVLASRARDSLVIPGMKYVEELRKSNDACVKIYAQNEGIRIIESRTITRAEYNQNTNILTYTFNNRNYSFDFNEYNISRDEVIDFIRYLKLQKAAYPNEDRFILVSAHCTPMSHAVATEPLVADAPNTLINGLVNEDLILSSVASGIDYDEDRSASKIDRAVSIKPMDIILQGIKNENRTKKIFAQFDIYDILMDIIAGVNSYGISLELKKGGLNFSNADGKIVPNVEFNFQANRRGEFDYSQQASFSSATPYGEMVKSICDQLNSYNSSQSFAQRNFPQSYKAAVLMTVLYNVYDKLPNTNLGNKLYDRYIYDKHMEIPIDQHRFRDEIFNVTPSGINKREHALFIKDAIDKDILSNNKLLSLFMQYNYYIELHNTYSTLLEPGIRKMDDYWAREFSLATVRGMAESLAAEIPKFEDAIYKIVYVAQGHFIETEKVDFYTVGPNLVSVLKNVYNEYAAGVTWLWLNGNVNLYLNNLKYGYNDFKDPRYQTFTAFSKVSGYSLNDYINDSFWHEYAHGLDTFLYSSWNNPYYFHAETEARAYLLQIAKSKNPYLMIDILLNVLSTTDANHQLGALIAFSVLRSVSGDNTFEATYMGKRAEDLQKIAADAYIYSHVIYDVAINKDGDKILPILPVNIANGNRNRVTNSPYIEPGRLFNYTVLPYVYYNSNDREHWISVIEAWPSDFKNNLEKLLGK
jgi:hypothetical protein